ncbi:hypothetical protein F3D3_0182 [Fusibacter sp. 3D3]|nr:hypothetical protein F3D3_0182 [Fusibacter sp. 3D3]
MPTATAFLIKGVQKLENKMTAVREQLGLTFIIFWSTMVVC